MTGAEKVLIVGGVLNLAYGALLGYPMIVIRAKGAPAVPRYLMAAHLGVLLHAAVLLGLVWAARLSTLTLAVWSASHGQPMAASLLSIT